MKHIIDPQDFSVSSVTVVSILKIKRLIYEYFISNKLSWKL